MYWQVESGIEWNQQQKQEIVDVIKSFVIYLKVERSNLTPTFFLFFIVVHKPARVPRLVESYALINKMKT
jgi:hypothetical protein